MMEGRPIKEQRREPQYAACGHHRESEHAASREQGHREGHSAREVTSMDEEERTWWDRALQDAEAAVNGTVTTHQAPNQVVTKCFIAGFAVLNCHR